MSDQAEILRRRMQKQFKGVSSPKTIAVVSGKGGVGKSNFSLNFAISLTRKGYKVLLFDMDVGMGNIDILLGKSSPYTIVDFLQGKESLANIIMEGPANLHYISGGSGLEQLVQYDESFALAIMDHLSSLLNNYEYVIFDMGAGVSKESLSIILSVDEVVVVTTPEPTSITDAYSMIKHIHLHNSEIPFYLVINRVLTEKDGVETFKRLKAVSKRFLGRDIQVLGIIPDDRAIQKSVNNQTPFIFNEKSSATKALLKITERYEKQLFSEIPKQESIRFVSKLKRLLFER